MDNFTALIYGVVQGITEYLPISSSAHLILLPRFMKTEDPGLAFDVFLHLGTLLATLIYFRKDWLAVFSRRNPLLKPIVISTIPALIIGAIAHKWIETVLRGNLILACSLTLGGILLVVVDRSARVTRGLDKMDDTSALKIGIIQCLALIPGISRSGSTLIGGRMIGLDRTAAARYSFLISAPVTAAALVFELRKWKDLAEGSVGYQGLLVAGVSSFVAGILAIGFLMNVLRKIGFAGFAVYRVLLAVLILVQLGV